MSSDSLVLELRAQEVNDNEENKIYNEIPRYEADTISYNDFFWQHMQANWPAVLTNVSNSWECRCNWTVPDNNNGTQINFNYLRNKIGECQVPVANCSLKYFNSHEKCDMSFYAFLDYWQKNINAAAQIDNSNDQRNLYLKDWHLKAQLPNYDFYKTPKHFASDWLNEYLIDNDKDDYRFVYMGPQNSWTPFHADVFGSYSWSTNILGCKKWILLPPEEEQKLCDALGNLPFSIDETELQKHNVKFFTLHQRENEAIFVPSGWYHQVWNLTNTISVNHNWFNACNLQPIWLNLSKNMQLVLAEIEDCRQMDNFDEHCQTMLRASFGINYLDFIDILEYIAALRLNESAQPSKTKSSKDLLYTLNDYHRRFDLHSITQILHDMLNDPVICKSRVGHYRNCLKLLDSIKDY